MKRAAHIIATAGALIAFMIGSGFATGQEVLQYFAGYGIAGYLGIAFCFVLILAACMHLVEIGCANKFERTGHVFYHLGGPYLGRFFDYFSTVSIYLCFVAMIAGAGAALTQYIGWPTALGAALMGLLSGLTVMFGLKKMVAILGRLGPVIIVSIMAVCLVVIVQAGGRNVGQAMADAAAAEMTRASSSWFLAACSYVGIAVLWLTNFISALGSVTAGYKETKHGVALGIVLFSLALALVALALQLNLAEVRNTEIPSLLLAARLGTWFATFFTLVIIAGIYTTSVPLLWTVAARLADDGSRRFRLTVLLLTAVGVVVAVFVPFSRLVNIVYVTIGYVGFALTAIILGRYAHARFGRNRRQASARQHI